MSVPYDKILVLGSPRGGTSLISTALGAHSRIAMLDEDYYDGINRITGGKIPANKLCMPNQIELDRKWRPVYELARFNGALRKSLFSGKRPRARYSIRDYDGFGKIQHVCILRHPAGVLKSIKARENKKLSVSTYTWRRCLEIMSEMDKDPKYDPVFVSFENLVTAPETVLGKLCDKLHLTFEDGMMNAPAVGVRYETSEGFQKSKAEYENAEQAWQHFDASVKTQYEEMLKKCL